MIPTKTYSKGRHVPALLALADGTLWHGTGFGAVGDRTGEVVFNTSLTGYQEILTDPSYHGQIVVMSQPHIGNYGVTADDDESARCWVSGFVVRAASPLASNWRATQTLDEYLTERGVVGLSEVDTRALIRHIRTHGAQNAALSSSDPDPQRLVALARAAPDMNGLDLARAVTCAEPYRWAAEGVVPPAEGDTSGAEGARRRRRRGGRGRNRGEGAASDAEANGSDEVALDANPDSPGIVEASEPVQPEPEAVATAEPAIEAPAAPAPVLPEPMAAARPIVVPSPAAAVAAMPVQAEAYALPIDRLNTVASAAGLEWVHSDGDKVRAAQAAIASEVKPPRVPREPKPPAAIDDGPLILVETKKDLSQIKLPFDRS